MDVRVYRVHKTCPTGRAGPAVSAHINLNRAYGFVEIATAPPIITGPDTTDVFPSPTPGIFHSLTTRKGVLFVPFGNTCVQQIYIATVPGPRCQCARSHC